jgi:hypothetical protein
MSTVASPPSLTSPLGYLVPSSSADPANSSTPAGFNVLQPGPVAPPKGPSQYQKALDAFKVTADTFLIQSALAGYQPPAASALLGSTAALYGSLNALA